MKAWGVLVMVTGVIALGGGIGTAAPGDIEFERAGKKSANVPPAVFPHWRHRIRYRCYVCHPKIFVMEAGGNEITMKKMREGKACGVCHNGETAFKVEFGSCSRCHVRPLE